MKMLGKKLASFLSLAMVVSCMGTPTFAEGYSEEANASVVGTAESTTDSAIQLEFESDFEWNGSAFGQSTDLNFKSTIATDKIGTNKAEEKEIMIKGAGGDITTSAAIVIESRGGKIANAHDGLTFYYTTLPTNQNFKLEAEVFVNQFGPESSTGATPNGQESAGLMVRDTNGISRKDPMEFGYEELPAASNIAATMVMMTAKSLNSPLRIQAYDRNGVTQPYGNVGVTRTASDMIKFNSTVNPFLISTEERASDGIYDEDQFIKLTLERTDDGFIMGYSDLDGSNASTKKVGGADRVAVIDKENMYVGFYASRNAKITVKDIKLTTSDANTVEEGFEAAKAGTYFNVASPTTSSTTAYTVRALTNYAGTMNVVQDGSTIATNKVVTAGEFFEFETALTNNSTNFEVTFTPSEGLTPGVPVTKNFTVAKNETYANRDLYVTTTGLASAEGTLEAPLDLNTALNFITPGYTIYIREGNYTGFTIPMDNSGNKDALKGLKAYNNEKVVFSACKLSGNYWHIQGVEVTGGSSTGFRMEGSYNVIENCKFYENGDTGLQISAASIGNPTTWPKYNKILNCESYENKDASRINADGFAAKLGVGPGNLFKGCISHNNADDGWDLFNKLENGANYPITIENCIAYKNGILADGTGGSVGSIGNGFKLGGEGLPADHVVKNSIAYNNNMDGFTCNFNPGQITIENCTSFDNARSNYIFRSNPYRAPSEQGNFINNISLRTDESYAINDFLSGNINKSYFFNNGNDTVKLSDFVSVVAPDAYDRDEKGNIIYGDFLRLTVLSALNSIGTNGTYVGALGANSNVEDGEFKWQGVAFGQSTDLNFSSTIAPEKVGINETRNITIQVDDNGTVSEVEAVQIESRGGKIANTHDGLTFYYTTLPTNKNFKLEANVYINQFGPVESVEKTPSGQEAVGLMVRDMNGIARKNPMEFGYEELPAASNVAATSIVTQGKTMNGYLRIQSYFRNGVVKPYGNVGATRAAADMIKFSATVEPQMTATKQRPSNGVYAKDDFIKLSLERTDEGFIMSYADSKGENIVRKEVKGADNVAVMDKENMYVGLYASRNAEATFTDIKLTVTEANTVPVGFEPAKESTYFKMLSGTASSTENYIVRALTNYDGVMTVIQDGKAIANDVAVKNGEYFEYPAKLASEKTSFEVIFTPSEGKTPGVAATNKVDVTLNSNYADKDLYVAVDATNAGAGTLESPVDLKTALDYLTPDHTIYVREGEYAGLNIEMSQSGNKNAVKTLKAYNNEKVIFGASKLDGNYWHLEGIEVTGAPSTGLRLTGSYNTIENSTFYKNGDTGLQISAASINNPSTWPRDNNIINCESFNNRDASGINADGFAAKLGVGINNVFKGCISHNNADDGWDLFNKLENYPNEPVTIDGCIAYENGLVEGFDEPTPGSIGNGFKLGGEGLPVDHILKNSIAFNNNMDGITCNFNPGQITVENCTSFNNARSNYIFRSNPYRQPEDQGIFKNNISFRTDVNYAINDFISGNVYKSFFFINGNDTVKASDFISLKVPTAFTRDKDNNIVYGDFLRLTSTSGLNKAGIDGKHVGALAAIPSSGGSGGDSGNSGSSGSSGGSSSTGGTTSTVVTIPETKVDQLVQEAIKKGNTQITLTGEANKVVEIPSSLFTGEISGIDKITITLGKDSVTLPVGAITVKADEKVYIEVIEQAKNTLNKEQQAAVGSNKVYSYNVLSGKTYKEAKAVTELNEVTNLQVAYAKATTQNENTLTMFKVLEDGTLQNMGGVYKNGIYSVPMDVTGTFIIKDNAVNFSDVKVTDTGYEAISFLASKGYVDGTKEGIFEPSKTMTRAEFTSLLTRVLHLREVSDVESFGDVTVNAWYTSSINACYKAGLISGVGNNKFAPQSIIKRQDMAALVVRAADYKGIYDKTAVSETKLNLADGDTISAYAEESVKALVDLGLLENTGVFRAQEAVTREEMAMAFEQLLKK